MAGAVVQEVVQENVNAQRAQGAAGLVADSSSSAAGEALLAVASHLPWIAPVAFLIGSIVKAAHDVHVLKGDALKFANFVCAAEAVLNEALSDINVVKEVDSAGAKKR